MAKWVLVILAALLQGSVSAAPAPPASEAFADILYRKRDFSGAAHEYRRLLHFTRDSRPTAERFQSKLALSQMHLGNFRGAMQALPLDSQAFSARYLRMYAALRSGLTQNALFERSRIRADQSSSARETAEADLLAGTVLLEESRLDAAAAHYRKLRKASDDAGIRRVSTEVLGALERYRATERKRGWLAGTLSAVLPGAGQWYSGHGADAVSALFFNTMFLGSAIVIYDLERQAGRAHGASVVFGLIGLIFYGANITGAVKSAQRYNIYQERVFQQRVRDSFFNLERAERISRLEFRVRH